METQWFDTNVILKMKTPSFTINEDQTGNGEESRFLNVEVTYITCILQSLY